MGGSTSTRNAKPKPTQQFSSAPTHPSLCPAPLPDWRAELYTDLSQLRSEWHWAYWPSSLTCLLMHWDLQMDQRWRSSLLWHDYTRTYTRERSEVLRVTCSSLAVPIQQQETDKEANRAGLTFLKTHCKETKTHAIAAMIACFSHDFHQFYTLSSSSDDCFELAIDLQGPTDVLRILSEVRAFISLCEKAINAYYRGVDLFVPAAVHEVVVERVFTTQVNEVLLAVLAADYREKLPRIAANLGLYAQLTCTNLGISPFFSVDRVKSGTEVSSAYEKAILALKGLSNATSPYKKLKLLLKSTHLICECIDAYWRDSPDIDRALLEVSTDQVLRIYLYLVLHSRAGDLVLQVRLMQEFLGKELLQSSFGYYVSTLEAAVEWSAELNSDFLAKLTAK